MKDIELVINISQEDYEAIKRGSVVGDMTIPYVFEAIRNGVQIPEGHGRIIDEKDLSLMTIHLIDGMLVCDVPTIIEESKGNEEKE